MTDRYTYRVTWSEEDQEYVATCAEFPSLSHLDGTGAQALSGLQALVASVVQDMTATGEPVPEPLAATAFSGKFMTRIPAELHRRLAIEAAEQRVSLNRLVAMKLAGEPALSPLPNDRPTGPVKPPTLPAAGRAKPRKASGS